MATDRPFLGWLYAVTMPIMGESPVSWHIFALVTRWLSALAVWWCIRGIWPERSQESAAIACLYAVYPGFTLQPIAWCHSHVFVTLGLATWSLGAMVWAHRIKRLFWPLSIGAILAGGITLVITEYFVGLELLRPVFLWVVFANMGLNRFRHLQHAFKAWSPYLAVLVAYLFWRFFLFHPSGVNDQSQVFHAIASHPLAYLFERSYAALTDLIEATFIAWTRTGSADIFTFERIRWVNVGLALIVSSAAATFLYLARFRADESETPPDKLSKLARWGKQAVGIGLIAFFVGGLPFWFGNRDVRLDTLSDRYTLPVMLGSILIVTGLIQQISRTRIQRILLFSLLIGLAVNLHFRNGWQFAQDWAYQKSLFWQLSWRAPSLKPGTLVLAEESVVSFPRSYNLIGPVNFVYAPHHASSELKYGFFGLATVLGDELRFLSNGERFSYAFRTLTFTTSTSNALVIWFSPPSCLRVLNPSRDELPQLPSLGRAARGMSHVDRVLPNTAVPVGPPDAIFGQEPEHSWCYYFQKADLARQVKDWAQVSLLGDEVRQLGFAPNDSTEWLPILEGYLQAGRYDDAIEVAAQVIKELPSTKSVMTAYDVNRVQKVLVPRVVPVASTELCRLLTVLAKSDVRSSAPTAFQSEFITHGSCTAT